MSSWPQEGFQLLLDLTKDLASLGKPLVFDRANQDAASWQTPLKELALHYLGGEEAFAQMIMTRWSKHENQGLLLPPFDPFENAYREAFAEQGFDEASQQALFEAILVLQLAGKLEHDELKLQARARVLHFLEYDRGTGPLELKTLDDSETDFFKALRERLNDPSPSEQRLSPAPFLRLAQQTFSDEGRDLNVAALATLAPTAAEILQLVRPSERPIQVEAAAARLASEYQDPNARFALIAMACPNGYSLATKLQSLGDVTPQGKPDPRKAEATTSLLRSAFDAYRSQEDDGSFPQHLPDPLAYATPGLFQITSEAEDNWCFQGGIFEWLADVLERDAYERLSWSSNDSRVMGTSLPVVAELLCTSPYLERADRLHSMYGRVPIARHMDFWSFPPAQTKEQFIARAARLIEQSEQLRDTDDLIEVPVLFSESFYRDGRGFSPQGQVDVKLNLPSRVCISIMDEQGAAYIYPGEYKATRYRVDGTGEFGKTLDLIGFIPRQETSAVTPHTQTGFYFPPEAASRKVQDSIWTPQGPSSITLAQIQEAANTPCAHPSITWVPIGNEEIDNVAGVQACCQDCGRSHLAVIPSWQLGGDLDDWLSPEAIKELPKTGLIACNIQRCLQDLMPYKNWQELRANEPELDPLQVQQQIKPSLGYRPPDPQLQEGDLEWESFSL